jgi:hypothetical protein
MQDVVIFLGPSLPQTEAEEILSSSDSCRVLYCPPVKRGDITALLAGTFPYASEHPLTPPVSPQIIGIIDGLFLEKAAVGHREILSALRAGITVIGSSSMGALRAFELESFGMIGIGDIFHLYRSGTIEADDEVALVCDPVSYVSLSEPLVHIRITLEKLYIEEYITSYERNLLFRAAKKRHYPERTWDQLFEDLSQSALSPEQFPSGHDPILVDRIGQLNELCQEHGVDQKHTDALSLLKYIRENYIM